MALQFFGESMVKFALILIVSFTIFVDLLAVKSAVKHLEVKSKAKLDGQLNYTQVVTLLLPSWVRKLHFPTVLPALCLLLLT